MNYDCCKSSNSLLEHRERPQSVKSEGGGGVVAQGSIRRLGPLSRVGTGPYRYRWTDCGSVHIFRVLFYSKFNN